MPSRLTPSRRAFWKRLRPTSVRHALEMCKEHAREAHNLSVEGIAAKMGQPDHWALYKWLQTGRFPFVLIPVYEAVCGINLATRWLAAQGDKLLVDMPIGKEATADDLVQLNSGFAKALQLLTDFYRAKGDRDAAPVLEALTDHMQGVAHHHFNVSGFMEPELDFNGGAHA